MPDPAAAPPPLLRAEGLRKAFGGLLAVDGVSLDLSSGEVHALIGPNGAGKSTLLALLAGELAPDAGRVLLAGRDATREPSWRRARLGVGRGFQTPRVLASATVLDHALLGALAPRGRGFGLLADPSRDPALLDAARLALDRVGLLDLADRHGADLAHGQRRRLEIATVLASRPRVLLLDEPLAGLGPEESAALLPLLADLRREHVLLLVEHDTDAVFALADRVSVLIEGHLAATGAPADVRRDPTVRAAYLGQG